MKKYLNEYKKLFENFFYKICSLECTNLIWKLIFKKLIFTTGALTSKPFAFKARSWELETKYIVNLTDGLGEKIRLDLKGLDIVRVLPWLSYKNTEGWISDKTRFSYDGFSLNRVNKFYLRKQLIFIPIIYLFLFLNNNLFKKYLFLFLNKNKIKKKIKLFWFSKEAIIDYFFSFFNYLNLFLLLFTHYSNLNYFFEFKNLYLLKFFNQSLNLNFFFKNFNVLNIEKNNKFLNLFFFKFKKKFNLKTFKIINLKFWLLQSFQFEKLYFFVLLPLLNKNYINSLNIIANNTIDLLTVSNINTNYYNNLIPYNLYFPFFSFSKNFNFKYFKFFNELNVFFNSDFIFLIGSNLWLNSPKMHILLRKISKNWTIKIISFANSDQLLFFNFNLGFNSKILNKIFLGQHWLNGFFFKSKKLLFVLGEEFLNCYNLLNFLKNLINLNKFFMQLNLFNSKNFSKERKNYFFSSCIFSYFNLSAPISHLLTFNFQSNNFFLNKKWIFYSFFQKKNKINLNLFLELNTVEKKKKFLSVLFNSKKSYDILFESVINDKNIHKNIDFVFPTVNYIEKFSTFIDYTGKLNKSLFVKFGPWMSKNFINFFICFNSLLLYPFLWLLTLKKQIFKFIFINLKMWLYGYIKIFVLKCSKFILKLNLFKFNFKINLEINSKFFNFFTKTNFWENSNSFVNASKYVKLGYNLYSKKYKTFNFIKL